jgi:hypothetical protein
MLGLPTQLCGSLHMAPQISQALRFPRNHDSDCSCLHSTELFKNRGCKFLQLISHDVKGGSQVIPFSRWSTPDTEEDRVFLN